MTDSALLEVQGVSLAFGGLRALSDVDLRVPAGSVVGLIGPNGAGKSTLFDVISGLRRPDRGTVRYAGEDVTHRPSHRRTQLGIGRSFQNLGLVGTATVLDNLMAAQHVDAGYHWCDPITRPRRWRRRERIIEERARIAADEFGIREWLDSLVDDLPFSIARFCELACVLVQAPTLMLLDEPTTGLDVTEVDRLLVLLRACRAQGMTVLVVAHDIRFTMQICDRIYVLREGMILFEGTPDEVQVHPEVISTYLGRAAAR